MLFLQHTEGVIWKGKMHRLLEFLSLCFAPTIPAQDALSSACLHLTLPFMLPRNFTTSRPSKPFSPQWIPSPLSPSGTYILYLPWGSCRAQPSDNSFYFFIYLVELFIYLSFYPSIHPSVSIASNTLEAPQEQCQDRSSWVLHSV